MNIQNLPSQTDIEAALELKPQHKRKRLMKRLIWLGLLVLIGAAGYWWYQSASATSAKMSYQTVPAEKGSLTLTVTATGTLQPTTQTDVSSEMSGIVRSVLVDYNSVVKKGDVLATLDTERYLAQLKSSEASLIASQSKLLDAEATLRAAELAFDRQQKLQQRDVGVVQNLEQAQATRDKAKAAVATAQADIAVAQSNLQLKKLDIAKSQILSPMNGIVLKRSVEPGQTVASSLQAPVLFTLAEDLSHMQLEANIDEADIGTVKVDQDATFTVDAFPGRIFQARIQTLQFSPQLTDGVVTYKAILSVDNADLSLRPGMTATATIITQKIDDALLISNAALRYMPPMENKSSGFSLSQLFMPRMPPRGDRGGKKMDKGQRTVWVLQDQKPVAVTITPGVSDGKMTEVAKGDIQAGTELITAATKGGGS